jgi:hypothetical protein
MLLHSNLCVHQSLTRTSFFPHCSKHLIVFLFVAVDQAQLFPGVQIYGGSHQSPALTQLVKGEDQFTLGNSLNVRSGFSSSNSRD